jgi:hypothetical protein
MMFCNLSRFCAQIFQISAIALVFAFSHLTTINTKVDASEYGKSVYPPGFRASMSGFVPPAPGTYLGIYKYFYSGEASGAAAASATLGHFGGNFSVQADMEVEAVTLIEIPNVLWMTPHKILGGKLGFGAFVPIGWQDVSVDVDALETLTLPALGVSLQRAAQFSVSQDTIEFGDPLAMALLGWDRGNLHWNVAGVVNIPIGAYDKTSLTNLGFNHWAFDTTASATWFDHHKGLEASIAAGIQYNFENPDTKYKSGTELHLEGAVMKHFSKAFAVGVAGYHNKQLTGDSGAGAVLGSFKGRVSALGPNINYNFKFRGTPMFTTARWLHEFDVKNRMKGDTAFFTLTIPMGGGGGDH